jgi:hypothetical protein
VIGVAGGAATRIEVEASIAQGATREEVMGKTADGEMRAAEEANEEAIRTTGAAQITEEVTMPATDNIRRTRHPTLPLPMATTVLPSPAVRKHKAWYSNNTTPTLSLRSCRICRHRPVYNQWQHMPTT